MENKYNPEEVQKAIDRDKSITKREAKLIHALLKGRSKTNENKTTSK